MIETVVGIIIKEGAVLLGQRKETSLYPLKWEFPGGKVEKNESIENCLKRELKEELNLDIKSCELYHQQFAEYKDSGKFFVHYYLINLKNENVRNLAFKQIAWIPISELKEFDILEGNKNVVKKLISDYE
ncbi:MAG: NUDIX domain-containing protein [Bacteroidetes bacterium]|nr:NUDIX domain-containing protein [Bacteroidota bacterium]